MQWILTIISDNYTLVNLNACHLFLQVFTLANIINPESTELYRNFLEEDHSMTSKSKLQWTIQLKQNKHSYILWRIIIHNLPQYNKHIMKLIINHILGRRIIPYIQRHRVYCFWYSYMIKEIFIQHEHCISIHFSKQISFNRHSIIVDTNTVISAILPGAVNIA